MANQADSGGERHGRRWRKAAWAAVVLLLLLPFLVLTAGIAVGEGDNVALAANATVGQ